MQACCLAGDSGNSRSDEGEAAMVSWSAGTFPVPFSFIPEECEKYRRGRAQVPFHFERISMRWYGIRSDCHDKSASHSSVML